VDSFEFKTKKYGDTEKNTTRIMNTFQSRDASTGVMLTGTKGSGKSLLAKCLAMRGATLGVPTLIINSPYYGDTFNRFLQEIQQECIILFDEFEKVYDSECQESILTLLDGVFPSKKLFVLTCNDKWRVDQHMRNRPGRIFYMIDFTGLSPEFIIEYCDDNLINKTHIDTVSKIVTLFSEFNFDMLKALIEEMNRYDESPQEVLKMLNVKPEYDKTSAKYNVKLIIGGSEIDKDDIESGDTWSGNPIACTSINFEYYVESKEPVTSDEPTVKGHWLFTSFKNEDLKKIEAESGKYIFVNSDGDTVVFTRAKPEYTDYMHLF
jgi:hypothetical protein